MGSRPVGLIDRKICKAFGRCKRIGWHAQPLITHPLRSCFASLLRIVMATVVVNGRVRVVLLGALTTDTPCRLRLWPRPWLRVRVRRRSSRNTEPTLTKWTRQCRSARLPTGLSATYPSKIRDVEF